MIKLEFITRQVYLDIKQNANIERTILEANRYHLYLKDNEYQKYLFWLKNHKLF